MFYESFTDAPHPVMLRRRRSGRHVSGGVDTEGEAGDGAGENSGNTAPRFYSGRTLSAVLSSLNNEVGLASPQSRKMDDKAVARHGAFAIAPGLPSYLPENPTTLCQASSFPEWPQWQEALKYEMDRRISSGVWKIVGRSKGKAVLDTWLVFKRKIDKDGQAEKYEYRHVAQGFHQVKGLHHQESS